MHCVYIELFESIYTESFYRNRIVLLNKEKDSEKANYH
jgi:hypothetical protein